MRTTGPGTSDQGTDRKAALLSAIRDENKAFYGIVIAQAQKIEISGDALTFTFAPVHKSLVTQLAGKKAWLEALAQRIIGRKLIVVTKEGPAAAPPLDPKAAEAAARQADLRARAEKEPAVQAILDVFGGEIEDVEEIS